ncbi:MAG: type II secretion system F family protein [Bacillota bacterium]|nr:type II secretion system F family protein [Bacillota bacterium]
MPHYQYRAIDKSGVMQTGLMEAETVLNLHSQLRQAQLYVVDFKEAKAKEETAGIGAFLIGGSVKPKDLALFCRQFSTMLGAGVPIMRALDILCQQMVNNKLKSTLLKVFETVQKGLFLSEAMRKQKKIFPDILISTVEAGEASGTLDTVFLRMAEHFEKEAKIKSKIRSASIYPIILIIVTILVVVVILTLVMPAFVKIFESGGAELPVPTKILMGISDFLVNQWYIVFPGIIALIVAFKVWTRSESGRLAWDGFKLKIPVVKKVVKNICSARFTRTMSMLLASAIPMVQALEISARVIGNKAMSKMILATQEDVQKGILLSTAIRKLNAFPILVPSMINIGEESGAIDDMLEKAAKLYDEEAEVSIQRMLGLLEPILIVIMAVVVGFIIISIALPMYSMFQAIK